MLIVRNIFKKIERSVLNFGLKYFMLASSYEGDVMGFVKKYNKDVFLTADEMYKICTLVKRTNKIEGDIAELGVYKGGSSRLICQFKGDRILHLFDTFEGLPNASKYDTKITSGKRYNKGEFSCSLENVKNKLAKYDNIEYHRGIFPSTAVSLRNNLFSLVHLDADLYESTKSALEFFYPRMSVGGVIITHDYPLSLGVKRAFDEFFKDKKEPIVQISGNQALIVKCNEK